MRPEPATSETVVRLGVGPSFDGIRAELPATRGDAPRALYGASISVLLMLLVLIALLGVLGAGIAGIVVLVSRNSKRSTGGGVQGVVGGWYPDPQDPVVDRYYDGQTWTVHTRPRITADE